MEFFWQNKRLQVQGMDSHENQFLMLLAEHDGVRRTTPPDPTTYIPVEVTPKPLDIEISKIGLGQWKASVPALVGVEYALGVSEDDAFNGVIIEALRAIANRIEQNRTIPEHVDTWFHKSHS